MKIFRNDSKPVETELTPVEHNSHNQVKALMSRINDGEIAQTKLKELRASCKHEAFYDTEGLPYDIRTCAICGAHLGLV